MSKERIDRSSEVHELLMRPILGSNPGISNAIHHSDYSVIASNFVNHLASIMLSNMFRFLDERKLLDDRTYDEILGLLLRIKMTRTSGNGEWKVRRIAETDAELLERIGLLCRPIIPKEVKKRGRPKGSKDSKPRKKKSENGPSKDNSLGMVQ